MVVLGLALCAVLAGARSSTAIAEWAADADQETRARLGVTGKVPCESTIRRVLQRLDAGAFDDLAGAWAQRRTAPAPGKRRVVAVDGKTLRGSGHGGEDARHLLAALDHTDGVVLGQADVGAKTNEIPLFSTLLDRIDITGAVVTADAMHAQREHATYLHSRGAHYVLTVKRNQPTLFAQLAPARGDHPRPLGHRRPPPLDPRPGLRRRPLPSPHRQRTPRHGQPPKSRHHHLAPDRSHQHRRSTPILG